MCVFELVFGGISKIHLANNPTIISDSGAARTSPKREQDGIGERNGRYISDADTNTSKYNEHMVNQNS